MATHSDDPDDLSNRRKDGNSDEGGGETHGCSNVQGLGLGLPDLGLKQKMGLRQKKGKEVSSKDYYYVSKTLDKLSQQTKEAFRGSEESTGRATRADGLGKDGGLNPEILEEWVKQFEELAGTQGMDSLVENMMRRLLSKEILHEPLKEIAARYPKWLEGHKERVSKEDYGLYAYQYEVMRELIEVYERDPHNFEKIVELMQKMQECGQLPPNEIVQELSPGVDLRQLGQICASWPLY